MAKVTTDQMSLRYTQRENIDLRIFENYILYIKRNFPDTGTFSEMQTFFNVQLR